jgi:hypothetical protein
MSDIKDLIDADLIDAVNLPKALLEKADAFLRTLLGPATVEGGELLAEKIRLRRFKNQVSVLRQVQEMIEGAGLKAQQVNLRTLVPLLERASLEEDPNIQQMWATLLANASQAIISEALQRICIQVLSGISSYEARILHTLYSDYLTQRHAQIAKLREWNSKRTEPYACSFFYRPHELLDKADVGVEEGEFLLDNLLQLGVLRFETPEVEDGEVQEPKFIHLTELGLKVLQACNSQPLKESGS